MACMMSRLVTRPAIPLPCRPAISIPCSAAIFRTSGEDLVRSRSSTDPPLPDGRAVGCNAAGVSAGFVGGPLAAFAVDWLFGGGPPLAAVAGAAAAGADAAGAGAGADTVAA